MAKHPVPFRITHHVDCGYRYSRVYARYADGTTTAYYVAGHVSA